MKSISLGSNEELFRRSLLFAGLYVLVMTISMTQKVATDPDISWHLTLGQWIVDHGAVPVTDPFSLYGQGKHWVAYSWLFELMVDGLWTGQGFWTRWTCNLYCSTIVGNCFRATHAYS